MNSLTMLGQLQAFSACYQKTSHMPSQARTTFEEAERLREAIEAFVTSSKAPVDIKDVRMELDISERSARDHLATLTKRERIKQLLTRPMSWTRKDK